jgi:hypothetical protein
MTMSDPAGREEFAGYLAGLEAEGAPLLGHMVLYSVYESQITPDQLAQWFGELGLDASFLPGGIRSVDVFEKITGPSGVRSVYPVGEAQTRAKRRREDKGQVATLMIRHVSRDGDEIVRHVVREIRDAGAKDLSYHSHIATVIFRRDGDPKAPHGAGSLRVIPDNGAIRQLGSAEQDQVAAMLDQVTEDMRYGRSYLSADRLRAMIRSYVENLLPVRLRAGVYFVGRQHAATLGQLRELVRRFNSKSALTRIPLPDQEEMRELVVSAFISRAEEDLAKLARDIDDARASDVGEATVQALHRRYQDLAKAAREHEELLGSAVDDTKAAMDLVNTQLTSLLLAQAS